MLVLTRKIGETLVLQLSNGEIITIKRVDENRLGIIAPQDVGIVRSELFYSKLEK